MTRRARRVGGRLLASVRVERGLLRGVLEAYAHALGEEPEAFRTRLLHAARLRAIRAQHTCEQSERELARYRVGHLLPQPAIQERVTRYETALGRT